MSNRAWRLCFGQAENEAAQLLDRFPLALVERAVGQGIDHSQQMSGVGGRLRFSQGQTRLDLAHGPVVIGGDRAVVQPGIAEGGVDMFVAQNGLDGQQRGPGIEQQGGAAMA